MDQNCEGYLLAPEQTFTKNISNKYCGNESLLFVKDPVTEMKVLWSIEIFKTYNSMCSDNNALMKMQQFQLIAYNCPIKKSLFTFPF